VPRVPLPTPLHLLPDRARAALAEVAALWAVVYDLSLWAVGADEEWLARRRDCRGTLGPAAGSEDILERIGADYGRRPVRSEDRPPPDVLVTLLRERYPQWVICDVAAGLVAVRKASLAPGGEGVTGVLTATRSAVLGNLIADARAAEARAEARAAVRYAGLRPAAGWAGTGTA